MSRTRRQPLICGHNPRVIEQPLLIFLAILKTGAARVICRRAHSVALGTSKPLTLSTRERVAVRRAFREARRAPASARGTPIAATKKDKAAANKNRVQAASDTRPIDPDECADEAGTAEQNGIMVACKQQRAITRCCASAQANSFNERQIFDYCISMIPC